VALGEAIVTILYLIQQPLAPTIIVVVLRFLEQVQEVLRGQELAAMDAISSVIALLVLAAVPMSIP
jgi:hypothetical protein